MRVQCYDGRWTVCANQEGLRSLIKQLLYFSCNNSMTYGSAGFSQEICGSGYDGVPLYIDFLPRESVDGNELYDEPVIHPSILIDSHFPNAPIRCPVEYKLDLETCEESIKITGDEKGFLFLARYVALLAYRSATDSLDLNTLCVKCSNGIQFYIKRMDLANESVLTV